MPAACLVWFLRLIGSFQSFFLSVHFHEHHITTGRTQTCYSKASWVIFFLSSSSSWLCLQVLHNWHEVRVTWEETQTHCLFQSLSGSVVGANAHDCTECNESCAKVTMAHLFTRVENGTFSRERKEREKSYERFKTHAWLRGSAESWTVEVVWRNRIHSPGAFERPWMTNTLYTLMLMTFSLERYSVSP